MYIAAPLGRLGLRGAAARRYATWPLAPVGLGATSHTCDSLYAIAQLVLLCIMLPLFPSHNEASYFVRLGDLRSSIITGGQKHVQCKQRGVDRN